MADLHSPKDFARLLERYFLLRLIQQRNVSPKTVSAYRDAIRLLLQFAAKKLNRSIEHLTLWDFDAPLVLDFLNHLEKDRHNCVRSRNSRLAAVRSFLRYAAAEDPAALGVIQPVLAIPMKRFERPLVGSLSREEITALLEAPDPRSWCGRRDRVMFATLYNTGARVSELTGMRIRDVEFDRHSFVRIHGKGRKQRTVPLWSATAKHIKQWMRSINCAPESWLFPNRGGGQLTRAGVTDRLKLAHHAAQARCPQLKKRRISPHLVRHATALHLLQSGVDLTVIALWLGHESPATTHMYMEADLAMKERALNALQAPKIKQHRYQPTGRVLEFLDRL